MRTAKVLVYESDGRVTAMLEETAKRRRWSLRQPRDFEECRELLRDGGPGVLALKVGRNLEFEMTLLERIAHLFPETGCVVVAESVHAPIAGVAWDLGADCVLILPQPRDLLCEVVEGLLRPAEGLP